MKRTSLIWVAIMSLFVVTAHSMEDTLSMKPRRVRSFIARDVPISQGINASFVNNRRNLSHTEINNILDRTLTTKEPAGTFDRKPASRSQETLRRLKGISKQKFA